MGCVESNLLLDFFFSFPFIEPNNVEALPLPFTCCGCCPCCDSECDKFLLLCLLSDRFVCILLIATPFSSIAKLKPRCVDRIPVDMSVRLAVGRSSEVREAIRLARLEGVVDSVGRLRWSRSCRK